MRDGSRRRMLSSAGRVRSARVCLAEEASHEGDAPRRPAGLFGDDVRLERGQLLVAVRAATTPAEEKHLAVDLPAAAETELERVDRERAREPLDDVIITTVIVDPGRDVQRGRIGQRTVDSGRQIERLPGGRVFGTAEPSRHGEMIPAAHANVVACEIDRRRGGRLATQRETPDEMPLGGQ